MEKFENRLRRLRIERGYTQSDLARALGISRSSIGMYEKGYRSPDLEIIREIADLLQADLNYLIGRADTQEDQPTLSIYEDMEQLIARNGKSLSSAEKMKLIKLLSELDEEEE